MLQQHDFVIKYCKAAQNKTADTLSHYIEEHVHDQSELQILRINIDFPEPLKQKMKTIGHEQDTDPVIARLKERVRQEDNQKYKLQDRVLYKYVYQEWKILLPQNVLEELVCANTKISHVLDRIAYIWQSGRHIYVTVCLRK